MEGVVNEAMTFDEVSMERSKSFVKALQELKNLKPQLNSAAEYCEKSYLHSEQKQMVLDNLKDYAVRALVNAIDHLGTVAYKLADVLEQQKEDVFTMDTKASCLNQQVLMSQVYMDKEGLRQQQLLGSIPRHHKHYILPNSVNKKVHFSPHVQNGPRQNHFRVKSDPQPSAAKTLSWHLASETTSSLEGNTHALSSGDNQASVTSSGDTFHLIDMDENRWKGSSDSASQQSRGGSVHSISTRTFGVPLRDSLESSKALTAFRSFDNPRREVIPAPARSKSMLSAFFVKQKAPKLKAESVP